MKRINSTNILENLLNKAENNAEQYYISEFDRMVKQIYINNEYWQLYIKNGIITKIQSMKEK